MSLATRGNVVWLGLVLSGVALGLYVLTAWPDTSPQVIRLPYGEAMPKTPRAVVPARKAEVAAASARPDVVRPAVAAPAAAPVPARVPASRPPAEEAVAPEESASELGAQPLPGTGQAQPQPAEQKQAAAPTQQAPAAEPASEPQSGSEEPPMLEIIIGSAPPSGPE